MAGAADAATAPATAPATAAASIDLLHPKHAGAFALRAALGAHVIAAGVRGVGAARDGGAAARDDDVHTVDVHAVKREHVVAGVAGNRDLSAVHRCGASERRVVTKAKEPKPLVQTAHLRQLCRRCDAFRELGSLRHCEFQGNRPASTVAQRGFSVISWPRPRRPAEAR